MPAPTTTPDFEAGAAGWPLKVRPLLEAVLVLAGEHELDTVLRRIVAGAATIAEAKCAALGIYDETGAIESFIHHGIDDDTATRIWSLPDGHGLLLSLQGAEDASGFAARTISVSPRCPLDTHEES